MLYTGEITGWSWIVNDQGPGRMSKEFGLISEGHGLVLLRSSFCVELDNYSRGWSGPTHLESNQQHAKHLVTHPLDT